MFESIKFAIETITLILNGLFIVILIYHGLKIYQDSRYNIRDSLSHIIYFYRKHYYIFLLTVFIFVLDMWYFQLMFSLTLVGIYLLMRKNKQIAKLKFTSRIIRIYVFIIISWTVLGTLLMMKVPFPHLTSFLALLGIFTPILSVLSGIALIPLEGLIAKGYQLKARRKLKKLKPSVIGITGSCGKTSVKNFALELLKENHLTFKSPKSFNTLNGISITINNYLNFENTYLLLEMGATKLKDIEKLVNFTNPQYGIITEIVPQHLKSFVNIDNIILEKMKLVESLPANGIAFLNYDNDYIRNYKLKTNCKIITFGTNDDCDYYATDLDFTLNKTRFTVHYNNKTITAETKLLGRHNVTNLLAAIALAKELGVSDNEIIDGIARIKQVPHRLELKKQDNLTIIDDAYNSNVNGFKNALEVLDLARGYRTLITPGIVDLGKDTYVINYNLSESIAKVCDEVILIENDASKSIYEGLNKLGFENIKLVKSFKEGFALIEKGTVLIENDLPDNYFL